MNDLISRKAAIDAVEHITSSMSVCVNSDECHGMKRMQRQTVIELTNLPPAQSSDDYERGWEDGRKALNGEELNMAETDLISRQAAIDAEAINGTERVNRQNPRTVRS